MLSIVYLQYYILHNALVKMYSTNTIKLLFFFLFVITLVEMEVPRLGVELKLLLQAYATATPTLDPCLICDLCCSLLQWWILNALSEARDQTRILMDTMLGS